VAGAHTPATQEVAALLATHGITKREGEIIQLICLGKTNQEIADELFISLATVKDHNYVAFQKLGVRNRTELTHRILQASLIQPK
jgi:DNA-binding NarL/FixJ family response regulator